MYISEDDKKKILDKSKDGLVDVIGEFTQLSKHGSSPEYYGKCPICGSQKLAISEAKSIFRCHKCQQISGKTPIDFLMKAKNYSFPDALKWLADYFNIIISEPPAKKVVKKKVKDKISKGKKEDGTAKQSYCARMLQESGLTFNDVTAKIFHSDKNKTVASSPTFISGTIDNHGNIDRTGDDAIIAYYNIDGEPITYEQKDSKGRLTGKIKEYFRVRWQYPEDHLDKEGKPFKYKSPYGAFTYIYIPERIREIYRKAEPINRLFIQEGEKKAEKACKHGIMSVAVSGIGNIATNKRLPEDIIKIIETCKVQEVVFMLDSDWQDISTNIKINDRVDKRPRNFFYAVKNFREYFRSLKNRELYVEIYFGYVLKNTAKDKGIDDLLANSLSGNEDKLLSDINYCMNEKSLTGEFVQFHKITTGTDYKLEELWGLNSPIEFSKLHKDILIDLPEFMIGRNRWRFNEKGEIESAQPIESDEKYWDEIEKRDRDGNTRINYEFKYNRSRIFLNNRGYGRYLRVDNTFEWIYMDSPVVSTVQPFEIRDFVEEFTKMNAPEDVLEMIIKGGSQYLGPDKLSGLPFIYPNFAKPNREKQLLYFSNICWEIGKESIKEMHHSDVSHHIWKDEKIDAMATLLKNRIISVDQDNNGKFSYKLSADGEKCTFLKYLINASNFTWKKKKFISEGKDNVALDPEEEYENIVHLISKLCAIGYLMFDCKEKTNARAVVGMDGKQSEVGASNGRSGKSLIGEAIRNLRKTVFIPGKNPELARDNFIWDEVTEMTKFVFIDDVRVNFDIEFLFANITGDWMVNYKGGRRCTLPFSKSPKIYITTNHAVKGEGTSFAARQWVIVFSDYYYDGFSPLDDFGQMFFDEWDFEQWNLFWNLMATCIQLYIRFGYVSSPGERIEIRKLRQEMTEEFFSWAEEFFSDNRKRNVRLARKDLFDAFLLYVPEQKKYCTSNSFKKRIQKYCQYKGYVFNPQKYDRLTGLPIYFDKDGSPIIDDKSAGVEYFTLGDSTSDVTEDIQPVMDFEPYDEHF